MVTIAIRKEESITKADPYKTIGQDKDMSRQGKDS